MLVDTISQDVRTELPWELLYADDLAIIDITSTDTQNRLESWQKVLTYNGLKINVAKTEHLSTRENPLPMKVNGDELKNVDHFKYLGSVIDRNDTIDRDVDLRVRAAWSSWRKLTGVLYDRKIPLRLKAKVYEAIIRPALTYGSECWAMKVTNKRKIATTEMRMLRGILGVSRRDHMRNEDIRRILNISPIDEVVRCGRLRWFGHVQIRDADNVTRRVMNLAISGTRRRRRPKKTWHQQLKDGMTAVGVTQDMALDRRSGDGGQDRPLRDRETASQGEQGEHWILTLYGDIIKNPFGMAATLLGILRNPRWHFTEMAVTSFLFVTDGSFMHLSLCFRGQPIH